MIKINRPAVPPDPETAKKLEVGRIKVMKFLEAEARQSRFDFSPKYWGKAKELLREIQHGKCAYCESAIGATSWGDIENFHPKSKFPELAYEWTNLLLSCQVCNANKRDQFPTEADGTPLLVDPGSEDPSMSITFDEAGIALPITPKGEVTIKTIALNRPELTNERARAINERARAIQKHLLSGEGRPSDDVVYAGAIRSVLDSMRARRPTGEKGGSTKKVGKKSRRKAGSTERPSDKVVSTPVKREFSYISSIHITNFRALTEVKLLVPLSDGMPGWQVLLGENAAGKSTVLKAIAMALMGSEFLASVTAYQKGILRRHKDESGVHESDSGSVTITLGQQPGPAATRAIQRAATRAATRAIQSEATRLDTAQDRSVSVPSLFEEILDNSFSSNLPDRRSVLSIPVVVGDVLSSAFSCVCWLRQGIGCPCIDRGCEKL